MFNYIIVGATLVVALFLLLIFSYNKFVTQKVTILGAWAEVEVELKRRHDLVPSLVETIKSYTSHESLTLMAVAIARNNAMATDFPTLGKREESEANLDDAFRGLLMLSESYPALKASQEFLDLQIELTDTEDRIASGRRFYNATVRMYRNRVKSFPSSIIAKLGGFTVEDFEFFQAQDAEQKEVVVNI